MTNYEYLVSKKALDSFLIDVHNLNWEELHSIYNIPSTMPTSQWLQSKYVRSVCYIIQVDYIAESSADSERIEVFKIRKISKDEINNYAYLSFKTYDTVAEAHRALAEYLEKGIQSK